MNRKDVAVRAGGAGLVAWAAFGALAAVVGSRGGAPVWPDESVLSWSVGHRPEMAAAVARGVTATGSGVVPYLLAALAGVIAGRTARHRLIAAPAFVACLVAVQELRYVVLDLIHRARPPHLDWAGHASGWAFPSGHTTTSAVTGGLLIVALTLRAPPGGTPLRIAIACWAALVGLTRAYLAVHWFTDVVGGWLFATGWLGLCLCLAARWIPEEFVTGGRQGR